MSRRSPFARIGSVAEAEAEVTLAKARLGNTIDEIKGRLAPSHLVEEAIGGMKSRSADLAGSAGEVMRERPAAVAAGAAGVALFVARRPLFRIIRRLFRR